MLLLVKTHAVSTVHPQHRTFVKYLLQKPKHPRKLTSKEMSEGGAWCMSDEEDVLFKMSPERTPNWNYVGTALAEEEKIQTSLTAEICRLQPSHCLLPHFVRILHHLWRTLISGLGEPSLLWANPESLIPLRLQSFAAILYVMSNASAFQTKQGVTIHGLQWDLSNIGKFVALWFDENIFLDKSIAPPQEEISNDHFVRNGCTSVKVDVRATKGIATDHDVNKSETKADDKSNGGCNLEPAGSAGDKTESSSKKGKDAEDEEIVGLHGNQAMVNQVSDTGGKKDTTLLEETSKLPTTLKTSENGINNNENLIERPNFDKDADSLSEVLKVKKMDSPSDDIPSENIRISSPSFDEKRNNSSFAERFDSPKLFSPRGRNYATPLSSSLETIMEDEKTGSSTAGPSALCKSPPMKGLILPNQTSYEKKMNFVDDELVHMPKGRTKQMRIPKKRGTGDRNTC